jgi:AraC family transcriptional regulator of arabinose operon
LLNVPAIPIELLEASYALIPSWNHRDTAAPWWRWYWNDRPGWSARFGGARYELGPRRVVLIAPETNFVACGPDPARHLYFHFVVGPPFHRLTGQVRMFDVSASITRWLRVCRRAIEQRDSVRVALSAPALCQTTLLELEPPRADVSVINVTRFMREHAQETLSNRQLAERVRMHPSSFTRWFKRQLGTTPHAWLTARKLERACSLLRYTPLSIEQVSEQLGFCDRFHFSRVFRRHRGCSPSAFRKGAI